MEVVKESDLWWHEEVENDCKGEQDNEIEGQAGDNLRDDVHGHESKLAHVWVPPDQ